MITVSTSKGKRITDRLKAYGKQASGYLKSQGVKHIVKELHGDNIVDLVVVYTDSIGADLITIMKEQTKSLNFVSNMTHQLLNKANVPVLTISNKETHIMTGFSTFGE